MGFGSDRRRSALRALALVALAIASAAAAEGVLRTERTTLGLALVAAAIVFAALSSRLLPMAPAETAAPPSLRPEHPRWLAAGAGALILALALQATGRAPIGQIASWTASIAAWSAAYCSRSHPHALGISGSPPPGAARAAWTAALPRPAWTGVLVLFAISLAACFFRLDRIPGGFHNDEAALGLEVLRLIEHGDTPPFATGWSDSPALFAWIEAGSVWLRGRGIDGLRSAAALGGALVVLPWFAFLRRDLGMLAAGSGALLLAVSPAHVHLSRLAQGESWAVLFGVASLGALFAALRTGEAAAYVHAGTWLALGFFTANKAVLAPPIALGAMLAFGLAAGRPALRHWRGLVLVAASALLVLLPQLADHARHGFWAPLFGHPSRWAHGPLGGAAFDHAARLTRLLIDGFEESSFSPFVAPGRAVTFGEGALFIVGLGVCIGRPRRALPAYLLGWWIAGLASLFPDTFPNQLPHMLLISPLPCAFGAVALHALATAVAGATRRSSAGGAAAGLIALLVSISGLWGYFGAGEGAGSWTNGELTELGRAMHDLAPTHQLTLVTPPMSWDLNTTFLYLAPGVHAESKLTGLDPEGRWVESPNRDVAFLVDGRLGDLVPLIRARYPEASIEERRGAAGKLRLAVIRVPKVQVERVESAFPTGRAHPPVP